MGKQGRVRWRVQKQVEIAERRWRVSALYLSGRSQPEIGKLLGIDPSTVASDVYALTQEWKAQSMQNMDEAKAQELGRVNRLEREYWDAYERSRQVKQRRVASRTENPDGTQTATASRVEEERVEGDPRFLAGVQWCIDKRCEILGLNAPVAINAQLQQHTDITLRLQQMNDDERRSYILSELQADDNISRFAQLGETLAVRRSIAATPDNADAPHGGSLGEGAAGVDAG